MKNKTSFRKNNLPEYTLILLFLGAFFLIGCGSGRNSENRINSYNELQELVNTSNFEIENDWVMPLRGNRINLIGNPNHIRFEGDSVDVYLPYFGVRQLGGGYGSSGGGIIYEGTAENLEIVENPERQNIVLKFRGQQENEDLQFFITLFPNGRTFTNVSSSQRDAISYQGTLRRILDER